MIDHHTRAKHLREFDEEWRIRNDSEAWDRVSLDGETPRVPCRYATVSSDGSENWLELYDSLDALAEGILSELGGEVPWVVFEAIDLDTGETIPFEFKVVLSETVKKEG